MLIKVFLHTSFIQFHLQTEQVRQVQNVIRQALDDLSRAKCDYEIHALRAKMEHLQEQAEEKLLMLQVQTI